MAIANGGPDDGLLSNPSDDHEVLERNGSSYMSVNAYEVPKGDQRHYQQQFADMYFARLAQLRPIVEKIGHEAFSGLVVADAKARKVERVLDVRQGELCWVVGTVYMDLPLKPNVLDDIAREHWIAAPPERYRYKNDSDEDKFALEDESGRLRLTGDMLKTQLLVTGAVVAVIGTENTDGAFEILDIKVPDLPRQPPRWEAQEAENALSNSALTSERISGGKIAIVSGLDLNEEDGDTVGLELLLEYLLGEAASPEDQADASRITRLIIAGNALTQASPIPPRDEAPILNKSKKNPYAYDSTTYNSASTDILDEWTASLLPTLPITILPGEEDPTATALPQPPVHMAYFPLSRAFAQLPGSKESSWFSSISNPAQFHVSGYTFLATGGQTVGDIFRYLDSESRVEMMESMLRWRLVAPTAPDTLWSYPFQDKDIFVLSECPHVYIAGNQPEFETSEIDGPLGQKVRLIAVPQFKKTGQVVLLDEDTLECEVMQVGFLEGDGIVV